jgi:3'(2'), 5'-bisphosphate nucleotidase
MYFDFRSLLIGRGAFARGLSAAVGAAFEVQVSEHDDATSTPLSESAEAAFGSREVTAHVAAALKLKHPYVRIDGQCKLCLVGAGSVGANMRLPPAGYIEKIWDVAPGYHYIMEAGGRVTDLEDRLLTFTSGRDMLASVTGVVSSNGLIHGQILDAVKAAKQSINNNP